MPDIEVYDSKNSNRLLGTLKVTEVIRGDVYSVALMDSPRSAPLPAPFDMPVRNSVTKIDFRIEWKRQVVEQGQFARTIREEAYMTTDAKLEDLMKLDRYCLPGEGSREAFYRRDHSDFY
ncbi:hypothetical protein MHM88_11220 [Epibacterium sp. MM17-32]|uniref:hypothetical protein n=1 Tax=Epibacterium sp. MM17-32 TaxID=2917734 RepID=UPI001EF46C3E|nr:hypothetical protein [Epibacterium sp. MM17-32]MCG7628378.1 hypothetical protein [Epibacterium sp. MM17-32]